MPHEKGAAPSGSSTQIPPALSEIQCMFLDSLNPYTVFQQSSGFTDTKGAYCGFFPCHNRMPWVLDVRKGGDYVGEACPGDKSALPDDQTVAGRIALIAAT